MTLGAGDVPDEDSSAAIADVRWLLGGEYGGGAGATTKVPTD